jgi:hypothetical protein
MAETNPNAGKNEKARIRNILGCILGSFTAIVFDILCFIFLMHLEETLYALFVIIYLINFGIIWVFTGKTKNNVLVWISSFLSLMLAYIISLAMMVTI